MPSSTSVRSPRKPKGSAADDANHHLVANRGFWWVCCSINATPRTKEKLGFSLGTKCLLTARMRRDAFLDGLHAQGLEVRIRRHSSVALAKLNMPPGNLPLVPWQKRVEDVLMRTRALELQAPPAPRPKRQRARALCCV